jgi:hypothetical protein
MTKELTQKISKYSLQQMRIRRVFIYDISSLIVNQMRAWGRRRLSDILAGTVRTVPALKQAIGMSREAGRAFEGSADRLCFLNTPAGCLWMSLIRIAKRHLATIPVFR